MSDRTGASGAGTGAGALDEAGRAAAEAAAVVDGVAALQPDLRTLVSELTGRDIQPGGVHTTHGESGLEVEVRIVVTATRKAAETAAEVRAAVLERVRAETGAEPARVRVVVCDIRSGVPPGEPMG